PDEEDIGLVQFDRVVVALGVEQPLVVVVDGHGQRPLGEALADDVLVQVFDNGAGRGDLGQDRGDGPDAPPLLLEDVLAEVNAVGADIDLVGPLDHGADVAAGLAAERAGGHAATAESPALTGRGGVLVGAVLPVLGHRSLTPFRATWLFGLEHPPPRAQAATVYRPGPPKSALGWPAGQVRTGLLMRRRAHVGSGKWTPGQIKAGRGPEFIRRQRPPL